MNFVLLTLLLMTSLIENSTEDGTFIEAMGDLIGMIQNTSDSTKAFSTVKTGSVYQYERETTFGNPEVYTTSGRVIGSTFEKTHGFFSIPYAAPPIGDLRFRETKPFQPTSEPINATVPDFVACYQQPQDECYAGRCLLNQKEDCLVLNVFVPRSVNLSNPSGSFGKKLSVLLSMNGEAFTSGSGTMPEVDGRHLSESSNSIVVTINYRLGPFGFLVYYEDEEDNTHDNQGQKDSQATDNRLNGNQGIKDQQMAMKWVQDNIENFGGDKDQVTLLGESAGAQSVMFHMLSRKSRPHFKRGVLRSALAKFFHQTLPKAMEVTKLLLKYLNCINGNVFQCLINAPADILALYRKIREDSAAKRDAWSAIEPYRPVIDGDEFTDQPLALFRSGNWNTDKDYIIGANTQEAEILQYYVPNSGVMSRSLFRDLNNMFWGDEAGEKISDFYEESIGPDGDDYSKLYGKETGDSFFICPSRAMARFTHETADNKNGNYFYISGVAPDGEYCDDVYPKNETCGYAYHTAETPYVFRTGPDFGYIFSVDEKIVADHFSKYLGNFARSGNPNDDTDGPSYPHRPNWPSYTNKTGSIHDHWITMYIYPTCYADVLHKEDICDFWDSLNIYGQTTPTDPTPKPVETTTSGADSTFNFHFSTLLFSFGLLINIIY